MFSCKISENFKNVYFEEHLRATAFNSTITSSEKQQAEVYSEPCQTYKMERFAKTNSS